MFFEPPSEIGSEHYANQNSGLSDIQVSTSKKILNNTNVVV